MTYACVYFYIFLTYTWILHLWKPMLTLEDKNKCMNFFFFFKCRQCSECDQAGSSDMEADMAMETLPDGTKRSRRQIKEPVKFVPQDMPPEPKKIPIRNTVIYSLFIIITTKFWGQNLRSEKDKGWTYTREPKKETCILLLVIFKSFLLYIMTYTTDNLRIYSLYIQLKAR